MIKSDETTLFCLSAAKAENFIESVSIGFISLLDSGYERHSSLRDERKN
jgi:hypothetical protein